MTLQKDLKAAGIPYVVESGRYADFYALSYTVNTWLQTNGVPPRMAPGTNEALRPQVDRPGLSRYQFANVAGDYAFDRRVCTVDSDIDSDSRRNLSFGVAGWRSG